MSLPLIFGSAQVDDLQNIGNLEGYIKSTGVILFFLSKMYFGSTNCLKEIWATLNQKKPIVLVHEQQQDKGGGPMDVIKLECPEVLRASIFDGRTPITWHRVSPYQKLTLKLVATEMLQYGPQYRSTLSEIAGVEAREAITLFLPGEVNISELVLPSPLVLWCSAGNPGAAEVARELESSMAEGGAGIEVVSSQPNMRKGKSAFMLLYLNKKTWVEQGKVLERDVRAARANQAVFKIVMVHENDPEKGGCEFGTFLGSTPQDLITDGIYRCGKPFDLQPFSPFMATSSLVLRHPCVQ